MTNQSAHEITDIEPRHAAAFGAGLAIFLGLVFVIALSVFRYFAFPYFGANQPQAFNDFQSLPEPQLQLFPQDDLDRLRRSNRQTLETYGWVDRESRIVRIPIERAMDIVAERGLPDFAPRGLK
jgi:hypothetical protein